MLKRIHLFVFLTAFFAQSSFSQSLENYTPLAQAEAYLFSEYPWLKENQNGIVLSHARQSVMGNHFLFIQTHAGLPVYEASAKVNLSGSHTLLSVFSDFVAIQKYPTQLHAQTAPNLQKVWFVKEGKLEPAYTQLVKNAKNEWEEQLLNSDLGLVKTVKRSLNARRDTLIQAKVFNPDPLTSAQKTYGEGGQWKNYNGSDSPELNAQRVLKAMKLKFENDTFFAENPFAIMLDLETPSQNVFASRVANFDFTRNTSQFREFNCLYHIENYRNYLTAIGLPLTGMFQLEVDPTAYQGFDQSRFDYSGIKPGLFFGTGGVPDVEDADVIVHEYTHAINYFIAPNTTNGNQRLAIEEANCDVMACFYSKDISSFNWRQIFNWDGHNEFWEGRDGDTKFKYPEDLSSDFYASSLIWSSMLNDIGEDIGREALTKILLNSIYSYGNNITMQQAANLFLQADSLVYGRKHFGPIKNRMIARGFDVSLGIKELTGESGFFRMINSEGFAQGNESLELLSKSKSAWEVIVYNLDGKEVLTKKSEGNSIKIEVQELPAGSYVLHINNQDYRTYARVIRY